MSKDTHNTTVIIAWQQYTAYTHNTHVKSVGVVPNQMLTCHGRNWTNYLLCVDRADNFSIKRGFEAKFKEELMHRWVKQEHITAYLGAVQYNSWTYSWVCFSFDIICAATNAVGIAVSVLLLSLPLSLSVHSIIGDMGNFNGCLTANSLVCSTCKFCQNLLQQCDQDLHPPKSIVHAQSRWVPG